MRFLLILLGCLACVKVWTQDRLVRAALGEALIDAYRERARQVCSHESIKSGFAGPTQWPVQGPAEIKIGSPSARVMVWDVNNPMWDVRYRHPHILLTSAGPRQLQCSYDINTGLAFVSAL